MNKKAVQSNSVKGTCCTKHMLDLILRYTDGTISARGARKVERHIKRCPQCAYALNASLETVRLTAGMRQDFREASVSEQETAKSKESLLAAIRLENPEFEPEIQVKGFNLKRTLYYSAGFAVALAVIVPTVLFTDILGMKSLTNETGDAPKQVMSQLAGSEERANAEDNFDSEMKADQGVEDESSDLMFLGGDAMERFKQISQDSIYSYTDSSDSSEVRIFLLYLPDEVDAKINEFNELFEDLRIEPEIEVISRDNMQKLVEYTGTQSADDISRMAVERDADILVILIGR